MTRQTLKGSIPVLLSGMLVWIGSAVMAPAIVRIASAEETKETGVDSGITERGFADNLSDFRFPKRAPVSPRPPLSPPLPDLIPTGAAASGCLVYTQPDKSVIITVKNVGTSTAGETKTLIEPVGSKVLVQTRSLAPGERHVHVVPTECPHFYCPVRVTVDVENKVAESAESNNVKLFSCNP